MALPPLLPPLPTLTLASAQLNVPPDKPPEPSIAMPFPEATAYRAPGNPFRVPLSEKQKLEHKKSLKNAVGSVRAPFFFDLEEPINFVGKAVGVETTTEEFNSALITVIAALERGYFSSLDPTPLAPAEWARLSCAVLAAVGRGYCRQYSSEQEDYLQKVRAEVVDPKPLTKDNPTLFHRLASMAEHININIAPDVSDHRDWFLSLKEDFSVKATKAAAIEVEEKFLPWKANQFDRLANDSRQEVAAKARAEGENYFIETAQRVGLYITRDTSAPGATIPPPTRLAGKKRSASGSTTPATPNVALIAAPPSPGSTSSSVSTTRGRPATLTRGRSRAAALSQVGSKPPRDVSVHSRDRTAPTRDRTSSPPRRGRALTPSTSSLFRTRLDSLDRAASPQSILTLSPKVSINLGPPPCAVQSTTPSCPAPSRNRPGRPTGLPSRRIGTRYQSCYGTLCYQTGRSREGFNAPPSRAPRPPSSSSWLSTRTATTNPPTTPSHP